MKRIISIFLTVLMLFQVIAFAEEADNVANTATEVEAEDEITALIKKHLTHLIDRDRIFKYDYLEDVEEEENIEVLKNLNAVNVVTTLGIMEYLPDGTFGEDQAVMYEEFASIILKLNNGIDVGALEEQYKLYPDTLYATHNDAAHYIVGAIGYDVFEKKYKVENPRSYIAKDKDLCDGIKFVGEKNITRGELARMIFNALESEVITQSSFGSVEEFQTIPGETLIKKLFDAQIIYGTVTAQNGISIYNGDEVEAQEIKIDKVAYRLNDLVVPDVLGYRVMAVVRFDDDIYDVLGISVDEKDETICITLDDNTYIDGNVLYYVQDGNERKQNISKLERITVNGNSISISDFKANFENMSGELRLAKSKRYGDYTILIVRNPSSFVVDRVSLLVEKIHLAYGALYNGNNYIDINDSKTIYVFKNGAIATVSDIATEDVIDVVESQGGNVLTIYVTSAPIKGKIEEIDQNTVKIKDKEYRVSSAYYNLSGETKPLPEIKLNLEGEFLLNAYGEIVGKVEGGSDCKVGVISKIGKVDNSRLNKKYAARILTGVNTWENINFAEKIELDGREDVAVEDAIATLEPIKERVFYQPMRYKLNKDNEIILIDTIIHNIEENGDYEAIKLAGSMTDMYINWTAKDGKAGTLSETPFVIHPEYYYIEIPEDRTAEEEYYLSTRHNLVNASRVDLSYYCADELNRVKILVKAAGASAMKNDGSATSAIFMGLQYAKNSDGEEYAIMKIGSPETDLTKIRITERAFLRDVETFTKGDVLMLDLNGDKLMNYKVLTTADKLFTTDYEDDTATYTQEGIGTVVGIDTKQGVITVRIGDDNEAWLLRTKNGIYDTTKNTYQPIASGDISIGDRVLGIGLYNNMYVTILK